jgi:hypothetical protein
MTPVHAIMVLIIRLWAAGFIITGVWHVGLLVYEALFRLTEFQSDQIEYYAYYIFLLFLGAAAWFFARSLAERLYCSRAEDGVTINVSANSLVMTGSFLIGMFYLVKFAPRMASYLITFLIELGQREPDGITHVGTTLNLQSVGADAFVFLVATWMAFKPAHLAQLFSNLRTVGQYETKTNKAE